MFDVTRRRFLQSLGATAGALSVNAFSIGAVVGGSVVTGTAQQVAAAEPGLKLHKAVKYSMIGGDASLADKFLLAKEVGFAGVDMNVPANHDEVNAAQQSTGLVVHGVVAYEHWRKPLSDADPDVRAVGLESLKTSLRDCKAYGGTTVLLVPAVVTKQVSYADAYTRSQAEIRKALPLAEELGIRILFENVWNNFLLSPLEYARYIDEFESPWVGAYFDVGNVVRYGWPEQWIRILGKERIGKLDIKEYSRKIADEEGVRKGFQAELGDDTDGCDWPAVLAALQEIGYSGWATAEVRGGDRERLAEISRQMDKIFAGYGESR